MDTIESEIMLLYQNFKNTKESAKRLYDKIVVLQNYEENYNYKSILNSAYLKRKISKVLFNPPNNFDNVLNDFNNITYPVEEVNQLNPNMVNKNKSVRFNNPAQPSSSPEGLPTEPEQDFTNMLNLDEKELDKVKNMSIVEQQEYLVNKYLDDDWDINSHINERRAESQKVQIEEVNQLNEVAEKHNTDFEKIKFIRNLQIASLDGFNDDNDNNDDNVSTSTLSDNIE